MPKYTGITRETYRRFVVDAGVVRAGYIDGDTPGTLLGATRGGATYTVETEYKDMGVDGAPGPVKGSRRIVKVNGKIEATFIDFSPALIMKAIPGATGVDFAAGKAFTLTLLGLEAGDTILIGEDQYTADATTTTKASKEFSISGSDSADATELASCINDSVNGSVGVTAVANGAILTITGPSTLTVSGIVVKAVVAPATIPATHTEIKRALALALSDYTDSIALIGEVSGSAEPIILKLSNVLADGNFEIGTTDKEEAGLKVQFTAHFNPDDLVNEPWLVRFPKDVMVPSA